MIRKIIYCFTVIVILFLFIQDSLSAARSVKSSESRFNSAISCEDSLRQSKKKQKYRKEWERCITKFVSISNAPANNEDGLREKSIFHAAELYLGLYRYSGRKSDLISAKDLFFKLTTDYPDSELHETSVARINNIDRIINDKWKGKKTKKESENVKVKAKDIRYWSHTKYTRIVLDLNAVVKFEQTASLSDNKLTLNFNNLVVDENLKRKIEAINDSIIKEVLVYKEEAGITAISFKFDGLKKFKVFPLPSPPRLVIDLFSRDNEKDIATQPQQRSSSRINTIIIDPGHGGKDPGAIGKSGLTEKEVVLDIGLRLKEMLVSKIGKRVIMTRETDVFIPLDERSRLANGNNGDMFVSIHANSSPRRHTRGIEVYLLGASSDKRALATAARENFTTEEDVNYLQIILNDLAKDFTTEKSLEFAHLTMESFSGILRERYDMVKLGVKKAPFYVLIHTDMPSILAEVSFISNHYEETLLKKDDYRQKIAEALFEGIKDYIQQGQIPF